MVLVGIKKTVEAYAARRHGSYIGATINRGSPQQISAQGALTDTVIHASPRTYILTAAQP